MSNILIFVFLISTIFLDPQLGISKNYDSNDPDSGYVIIYFAGDVTFANHFEKHVSKNFSYPFKRLKWFADADITMVNLENPLTTRGAPVPKQFNFRALPEYVNVLQDGGIDIVTLANNHIYDYSDEGLFDTIAFLDSSGIKHVGAGKNITEAREPVIFNVKGITIGFLGYYGMGRHSDSHPAGKEKAGTALRSLKYIKEDVQILKDSVDLVVVNFHWGEEKENYPGKSQIQFAHKVIDYGADLIIGHHPHVLQGVERYKDRIIAYSLGNFIFGGNSRKTYKSAIFKVTVNVNNVKDYQTEIIPIQVDYWQPFRLEGEAGNKVIQDVKKYSSIFKENIFSK